MARVEIQQLEELEVFDSLRLSVVVTAEILIEIAAEVFAEVINKMELKPNYSSGNP